MKVTKKSLFDLHIIVTASAAVFGDVLATVMIAPGGCTSFLGFLLWVFVVAFFVGIVLLPAIVRWLFVAPLNSIVVRLLLGTIIATAIPGLLATIQDDKNMGHCIS